MKAIKYLLALVAVGGLMTACDTDIETKEIQKPYTYSPLYYQNLRDYKASDHSIAFMWFAQYGAQNSMAVRFVGLPDSLDICSLWGGIPAKENTQLWEELRFVQKTKGTKMLVVAITRIDAETDDKDFKKVYNEAKAMPHTTEAETEARNAAINHAIELYAEYFLDQVFLNDLDGFDADYEPEGDFLSGNYFLHFMKHLAKYMGPLPADSATAEQDRLALIKARYGDRIAYDENITRKLLCVDSPGCGPTSCIDICNYTFNQAYGGGTSNGGWPWEKVVLCENVGDNWQGTLSGMYNQARFQPAVGRKGGFGAFFGHRDYNIHTNSLEPYYRFRECIQIQNPAIY